jgi:hypothetical protein
MMMLLNQQYKVSFALNNHGVQLLKMHSYSEALHCFQRSFKLLRTVVASLDDDQSSSTENLEPSLLSLDDLNIILNESLAIVTQVKGDCMTTETSDSDDDYDDYDDYDFDETNLLSLRMVTDEGTLNGPIIHAAFGTDGHNNNANLDHDIVCFYIDDLDGQRTLEENTDISFETAMILFNFGTAQRLHTMSAAYRRLDTAFYSSNGQHILSQSKTLYRLSLSILTAMIDDKNNDKIQSLQSSMLSMIVLKGLIEICNLDGSVDDQSNYYRQLQTLQNDTKSIGDVLKWMHDMQLIVVASAA